MRINKQYVKNHAATETELRLGEHSTAAVDKTSEVYNTDINRGMFFHQFHPGRVANLRESAKKQITKIFQHAIPTPCTFVGALSPRLFAEGTGLVFSRNARSLVSSKQDFGSDILGSSSKALNDFPHMDLSLIHI